MADDGPVHGDGLQRARQHDVVRRVDGRGSLRCSRRWCDSPAPLTLVPCRPVLTSDSRRLTHAGGYGEECAAAAAAPARQVEVDYRGQARGGDGLVVITWWDAEAAAFCFEVRDDGRGEATESISDGGGEHEEGAELLTTGRIWPAETGSARL